MGEQEEEVLFWWEAVGENGVLALVAASTPDRAVELLQWDDLTGSRLTALHAESLADGPSAAAETSQHQGWELKPADDRPAPPPAEGIYFIVVVRVQREG